MLYNLDTKITYDFEVQIIERENKILANFVWNYQNFEPISLELERQENGNIKYQNNLTLKNFTMIFFKENCEKSPLLQIGDELRGKEILWEGYLWSRSY